MLELHQRFGGEQLLSALPVVDDLVAVTTKQEMIFDLVGQLDRLFAVASNAIACRRNNMSILRKVVGTPAHVVTANICIAALASATGSSPQQALIAWFQIPIAPL
ncbi:MAG TPA: hypothetical protein DEA92_15250 [Pseudomonas sp.]|nr:hypothetical protein [Pseudomonas sp.]